MSEAPTLIDQIQSSYAATAAWVERIASWLFTTAERLLVVGAFKLAASSLPAKHPQYDNAQLAAALINLVFTVSLSTQLYALLASDFKTFAGIRSTSRPLVRRTGLFALGVGIVAQGYWLNGVISHAVAAVIAGIMSSAGP
jgi:hypothetical protein